MLLALPIRPSDPAHPRTPLGRGDDTFGDVTMLRNIPGRREELASSRGLSGGYYAGDKWKGGGRERKHRNEESNWEAIAAVWERAVWEKAVNGSGAGQVWKFWTYFEGRVERICRLSG